METRKDGSGANETHLSNGQFAEIIIPLALPKNYTWQIPATLEEPLTPGCRVEVNLGRNKKYAGIIKSIFRDKPEFIDPKPILNVLDPEPVVYSEQLRLWEWIGHYYMCSEGEVMAAALPSHFKLSSETILVFNEEYGENFSGLDHDEYLVSEALLIKKELKLTEVQQLLDSSHVYPVINRLITKKVCFVWEALKQGYSPRKETYILLEKEYEDEKTLSELLNGPSRAPKQIELLLSYLHLLKTEGEVKKSELLKKSASTDAQLKALIQKKILRIEKRNVDRLPILPKDIRVDIELTKPQQKAYEEINDIFAQKKPCLIHGVTSSGKTMLYIKQIEEHIRKGEQVLYMLPEIALTSQIIRRLQKHFGGYVGVYHSKFSQNERIEIWQKVKSGDMKVVLGARSSVFLPFQKLGLVICDEEHDSSYKQHEPAPRYNGRDAAIFLASLFGSNVLLGSATPSIESYFNTTSGKYGLVTLSPRYGDLQLPEIRIVDTKRIPQKDKTKIMLSPPLMEAMNAALGRKKQVILFQNRRGYSPYQVCKFCGWIPQCRNCDVSLTFHKLSNKLICHYCGSTYPPVTTCAACGNHEFMQRNFGTERIEEQLIEQFPEAKIGRMDLDTVRGKNAHDTLIQQFEQGRIDILVGTQMVVKGLDFDNVDVVGILDADALLHFADFRVNERAFQLMEQVSGRAGRKEATGLVIIQTIQPTHPVLKFVEQHDYRGMFTEELEKRKQFSYPPYSRIIHFTFKHKMNDIVERGAVHYTDALRNKYGKFIVGPAEPVVNRIRGQYLIEMLLKLPKDASFIHKCKIDLHNGIAKLHNEKSFKSVTVIPDVDAL